ncbi:MULTISPECIES: GNAT family N-acetyltransferase [unclassified Streptomyces]|uniref:GNAT family N-acetyltransferase n=1 Tax=unclassified Streptomyces TaxID=2593676 RepID=UPI00037D0740|nr:MULTISPECIES: GNAT family N-acetyltransferase [unclassified Streptomyces]EYT84050.1 acetyltransferase [Streptomyces sp. Tu 6176]
MGVAIRAAGEDDRELVVRLLDESFRDDPVSSWVFPDAEYRRRTHHRLMGAFTDVVLADGRIDLTEDGAACALWLSMPASDDAHGSADPAAPADPGGLDGPGGRGGEPADPAVWMRETVDPANPRVEEIVRLLDATHPVGRAHEYLWMIAVAPDRQGAGLGGALVRHVLDRCDREGLPAYLEASSPRSTRLYERLGFAYTGTTVDLPDGPRMWPMWREPGTGDRTAEER